MKSLGIRLALAYALVSTLTLACLFVAGYYLLNRHLIKSLDVLNAAEFAQLKALLASEGPPLSAPEIERRIRTSTEQATLLFLVEVRATGGEVLFRSSNLGDRSLPRDAGTHVVEPGGASFRVARFALGPQEVWLATPMAQVQKVMDGYAQISLVLVCLLLVASVITGLVLSRVALRPVRIIQETADRIRFDNLSERIPVSEVRDEVSDLARLLNEMFDRLESSFNQVRRFSAEASHELKTPLALVRLQSEKLLLDGGLTPAQEEALHVQLEEIGRLNQIIEELLFLSRAEARAIAPEFRREDPRAFLEVFATDARVLAENAGVSFDLAVEGEGLVDFDAKWVRRVLLNLVSNALRVAPRGSTVVLTSDFTLETWRVAVDDEGPGVPAEQRERIFERFVRLAAGDRSEESNAGSGLGLAISRSIVELHRGRIYAEASTRGRGLRVVFELPIATPEQPVPAREEAGRPVLHSQMD